MQLQIAEQILLSPPTHSHIDIAFISIDMHSAQLRRR